MGKKGLERGEKKKGREGKGMNEVKTIREGEAMKKKSPTSETIKAHEKQK